MIWYVLRRIAAVVPILLGVSLVCFSYARSKRVPTLFFSSVSSQFCEPFTEL